MNYYTNYGGTRKSITLDTDSREISDGDTSESFEIKNSGKGRFLIRLGRHIFRVSGVEVDGDIVSFKYNNRPVSVEVRDDQDLLLDRLGMRNSSSVREESLKAPMPGRLLSLNVKEGDTVNQGDAVAVLEAMKMENELKAPVAGTIGRILVTQKQSVEKNDVIMEIEARG